MWYVATPNILKSGFCEAQHDRKPPLYRAETTRNTRGVARSAQHPPPPPVHEGTPAAVILGRQERLPANQARHTGSESSLPLPPAATPPPASLDAAPASPLQDRAPAEALEGRSEGRLGRVKRSV